MAERVNNSFTRKLNLGAFDSPASGALRTKKVDPIYNIHAVYLRCLKAGGVLCTAAEVIADIVNIEIKVVDQIQGERTLFRGSAADAYMFHAFEHGYKSGYAQVGVIPILFTRQRLWLGVPPGVLSIGTRDTTSFYVHLTFKTGALVVTDVEMSVEADYNDRAPLGQYASLISQPRSFTGTGENVIDNLPHNQAGKGLASIHITTPGTSVIDSYTLERNGANVAKNVSDAFNDVILHHAQRVQTAGYFHIDLQDHLEFLITQGAASLLLVPSWNVAGGAPGQFSVLTDELHNIDYSKLTKAG